jgi:hypothetical protein
MSDTTATNTQTPTTWEACASHHERTRFLLPFIGQPIRYALNRAVSEGRVAFGDDFPIPYKTGKLAALKVDNRGRPAIVIEVPSPDTQRMMGGVALPLFFGPATATEMFSFESLYDVALDEQAEAAAHAARMAQALKTTPNVAPFASALDTMKTVSTIIHRVAESNPVQVYGTDNHGGHEFRCLYRCGGAMEPQEGEMPKFMHSDDCAYVLAQRLLDGGRVEPAE